MHPESCRESIRRAPIVGEVHLASQLDEPVGSARHALAPSWKSARKAGSRHCDATSGGQLDNGQIIAPQK